MTKFIQLFFVVMCNLIFNMAQAQTLTIGQPIADIEGADRWLYNPNNYFVVVLPDRAACPAQISFPLTNDHNQYYALPILEANIKPDTLGFPVPLEDGRAYAVGAYSRLTTGYISLTSDCMHVTASPGSEHYFAPSFYDVPNAELMRKTVEVLSAPRSGGFYVGFTRGTACAELIADRNRVVKLATDLRQSIELIGGPHWQYGIYQKRSDGRFAQVGESCKPVDVRWFTSYEEIRPMPPPGSFWTLSGGRVLAGFDLPSHGRMGISLVAEPMFIGSPHLGLSPLVHLGFNPDVPGSPYIRPSVAMGVAVGGSRELTTNLLFTWRVGTMGGFSAFSTHCSASDEVWQCRGTGKPLTMFGPNWSQLVSASFTWPVRKQLRIGVGFVAINQLFAANPKRTYVVTLREGDDSMWQAIQLTSRWHAEVHVAFPTMVLEW